MTRVIIDAVICVVWLAACILFIRQIQEKKTGRYIVAAVLFILFTALSAGSAFGRYLAIQKVEALSNELKTYLAENFGNNQLVRDGVDISNASKTIDELEAMGLSQLNELGSTGLIAKEVYKIASKEIIKTVRTKTDAIVSYAEKEGSGKITVGTLLNIVKDQIFKILFWIVLVIHIIVWVFMAVHLCRCFLMAKRKSA